MRAIDPKKKKSKRCKTEPATDGWMRAANLCKEEKNAHYYADNQGEQKDRKVKGDETSKRVKSAFRSCFVFIFLLLPRSGGVFFLVCTTHVARKE